MLSGGAGEGPRLRGGSDGVALLPPSTLVLVPLLPLPTTRWIKLSTVVAALLLSFTAPPLTVWMRSRCFRVVGDCRMRSAREGGGSVFEEEDGVFGLGEAAELLGVLVDGVECAMYRFEAVFIALVSRVVVPEMAWLKLKVLVSE